MSKDTSHAEAKVSKTYSTFKMDPDLHQMLRMVAAYRDEPLVAFGNSLFRKALQVEYDKMVRVLAERQQTK